MTIANPTFGELMLGGREAFDIASRARDKFIADPTDKRALDSWRWWSVRSARLYGAARSRRLHMYVPPFRLSSVGKLGR